MKIAETFVTRPRPRPLTQDQDRDQDPCNETKTKTSVYVLEGPRDRDLGLEDYNTVKDGKIPEDWILMRAPRENDLYVLSMESATTSSGMLSVSSQMPLKKNLSYGTEGWGISVFER